ncbi:zinc-ribbon domain-containing protein, partial [Streptomyces sp. Termitarium-T10T-6]
MPVCTRCGHRNAEASKFCSNCGAPLRGGVPERPSETTSTISISGLEAYEAEATGQTALPSLSPEAPGRGRRAARGLGAPGRAARPEFRQPLPA